MGEHPPGPDEDHEAVRALCAVMERLESLWERERHSHSSYVVSASQLRVLYELERTDGVNLRELGAALRSAPSPLSRLCTRLEVMGFIRRVPSPQSGREIELHLTPQARSYLDELRQGRARALSTVLTAIPRSQRRPLAESADVLRRALEQYGEIPDGAARSA
ncbi:MarR family transcriptional regulator [Streptomyces sp. NPDC046939]|uniref:MarR family winged helix-turn-helix transcriptional regulator n=1 Tax=Streptomyces sp. NPDC046939 TaxID=3155376 RepID=UPI0033E56530